MRGELVDGDTLDPMLVEEIERVATQLATDGGRMAAARFRRPLTVEYKGPDRRSPVTEADRMVEDYLRERIADRFPSHCILGEEGQHFGPAGADFVWVLDPIDGTANFVSGLPIFAVSIGVLFRGQPIAAALYASCGPRLHDDVLHARKGGGCYLEEERLRVFDEGVYHPRHTAAVSPAVGADTIDAPLFRSSPPEPRTLGSIANELALVAAGSFQFAMYLSPRIWDIAGGMLLVTEAGGRVMHWDASASLWLPLHNFIPPGGKSGKTEPPLSEWSRPVLAGGPAATSWLAARVRPRGAFGRRLRRWLWHKLT